MKDEFKRQRKLNRGRDYPKDPTHIYRRIARSNVRDMDRRMFREYK